MNKKRLKVMVFLFLITTVLFLVACKRDKTEIVFTTGLGTNDVFKIGNNSCTLPEALVYLTNIQNQYESLYGVEMWSKDSGEVRLEEFLKDKVLNELAQIKCMNLLAEQKEILLSKEEENQIAKAAKVYFQSLSKAEKDYMQVKEDTIVKLYEEFSIANKLYLSLTEEVQQQEVSDDDARVMEVMQIYTKDKGVADNALGKISQGSEFSTVANVDSEKTEIEREVARGQLPSEVEAVVFELEDGEMTGVLEGDQGYYIIKCISGFNKERTDANKENISHKRKQQAFSSAYDPFEAKQLSFYNEKLWKSITFTEDEKIVTEDFFDQYSKYCE